MVNLFCSFAFPLLLFSAGVSVAKNTACKCSFLDACWPSESEFFTLNHSISGRLIQTTPLASVCYKSWPNHDSKACEFVLSNWFDSSLHSQDPTSIDSPIWAGNPCPPIYSNGTSVTGDPDAGSKGCTLGSYPAFVINATEPLHVQEAVIFARKHNIRLNVKSTGHSFQGRSTAFSSLSLYMGNYRGIEYHEYFAPMLCPQPNVRMAATIRAGEDLKSIYTQLAQKHNAVIVGGSAQTVGIIGWFTGGGYGPLSSEYGMGADNVLQVTMVTPDGDVVTANACQHPDLFWAVRGGGGGTFGVILEVVMKAYPSPRTTMFTMRAQFTAANDAKNWREVAHFHSNMLPLKEGGLQGYYRLIPSSVAGNLTLELGFLTFDKPNSTAEALFAPIISHFDRTTKTVRYTTSTSHFDTFFDAWSFYSGFEPVAQSGMGFGSRLLSASALSDVDRLGEALSKVTASRDGQTPVFLLGHMIANSKNAGFEISMNPAWRETVTHLIVVDPFPDCASKGTQEEVYQRMTYKRVPILKRLAPETGAYMNEADPFDPEFQTSFWGKNYDKLKAIKEKYDSTSVLWCISCVGSEDWVLREDGRLCHV